MLSVEPGEAVKTPEKWGEDMAGEVADLEFSFLTTQGPHHPGDSLFPDGPPQQPSKAEGTGRKTLPSHGHGGRGVRRTV